MYRWGVFLITEMYIIQIHFANAIPTSRLGKS